MNGYWITFTDGSQGYCEGANEYDAKEIAEKLTGKTVGGGPWKDFTMKRLPYPASPIIWQLDHPVNGKCPAFCHSPKKCAGSTACQQRFSCTE
ncbi:hypothetical protein [Rhizobium sp. AB2/73]|uniref:hypothetical protein n=1 Tax=Rhizobium sp. AB2/73 TaxID=2795216 RepID=UPI001C5EE8EF|nr:hypothetical protein [Rhizobium sp. AB2/73]QYA12128.1 hypothetical protein J5284_16645 [Rhizobium sp. AB2/73]UEQ81941.1 hypothetical protein I8E17_05360 [Rhizobium sp. AB2/73]